MWSDPTKHLVSPNDKSRELQASSDNFHRRSAHAKEEYCRSGLLYHCPRSFCTFSLTFHFEIFDWLGERLIDDMESTCFLSITAFGKKKVKKYWRTWIFDQSQWSISPPPLCPSSLSFYPPCLWKLPLLSLSLTHTPRTGLCNITSKWKLWNGIH